MGHKTDMIKRIKQILRSPNVYQGPRGATRGQNQDKTVGNRSYDKTQILNILFILYTRKFKLIFNFSLSFMPLVQLSPNPISSACEWDPYFSFICHCSTKAAFLSDELHLRGFQLVTQPLISLPYPPHCH